MTTAIAILIYLGFAIYRHRLDVRRNDELKKMSKRMEAIEGALKSSPFVTYGKN